MSLPTLRRQLKHITEEMAFYYAKGSSNAVDLAGEDPEHFVHIYHRSKPEMDALAYVSDLLYGDGRMFGAPVIAMEKSSANILGEFRSDMEKKFKNGEVAYKETVLGVCLNFDFCRERALRVVTACVSCDKALIKEKKLFRAIEGQKRILANLDQGSMMWNTEKAQLDDLMRFRDKNRIEEG